MTNIVDCGFIFRLKYKVKISHIIMYTVIDLKILVNQALLKLQKHIIAFIPYLRNVSQTNQGAKLSHVIKIC